MATLWDSLRRAFVTPPPTRTPRSFRPSLESLEGRAVPSATPLAAPAGTVAALAPNAAQVPMEVKQIYQTTPGFDILKVGPSNRPANVVPLTLHAQAGKFSLHEVMTLTQGPTSGATYYMVTSKDPFPTAQSGGLKLRRVTAWYNNKPTISPYISSLTAPRWWYDQVRVYDIVREVNRITGTSWRWGKLNSDREIENLLVHNGEGLPNLGKGTIQTLGPSSLDYNCLSYGATYGWGTNPASVGWIYENGFRLPAGAKAGYAYRSYNDLVAKLGTYGWKADPFAGGLPDWARTKSSYLVLFTNPQGGVTHAAIWTKNGVYAKMGSDGLFRFDSLAQLEGTLYGKATQWFSR